MFKIKEGLYPILRQSVEMGRSFVVPSYQKKRLPLFMLWKGILYFLLKNPQYRYLYGPVSISKYYSNLSQSLIVAFIEKHYYDHELSAFLTPRKPFVAKVDKVDVETLTSHLEPPLKHLDDLIEDIETERMKVPVLIRQYIRLNARFISFNVDPNFSDSLDGFIIVDLTKVPSEMIESLKKEGI
jgi:putative hemolysin